MMEHFGMKKEKKVVKSVYCKQCGESNVFPTQVDENNIVIICRTCTIKNKIPMAERMSLDAYKKLMESLKDVESDSTDIDADEKQAKLDEKEVSKETESEDKTNGIKANE
jgi:transcription elongation factor Elf1